MQDSAKYLIHADIRASGVVERSDVVGAIFGQTEGLLGDDLDLRDLQESSKVGRIDVQIDSEAGRSYGTVTIASGLDRVETAVLAAALETIDRIGPCRSEFEVRELEDARAAKRREVVDRATELLAQFEETAMTSNELVEAVRRNVRVEDITEYEGLPAGPRVPKSDAIVVVEGRADVLQLLQYGIKNAIAVEGTDIPDAVAELTRERTVTVFLDGDRGGDLIFRELGQVGSIDYVAFAPADTSVEDLSRNEVLAALRKKTPYDHIADEQSPRDALAGGDEERVDADGGTAVTGKASEPDPGSERTPESNADRQPETTDSISETDSQFEGRSATAEDGGTAPESGPAVEGGSVTAEMAAEPAQPQTLAGHVEAVLGGEAGTVRLLDDDLDILEERDADEAFETIEDAEEVPHAVVLDGELSQRILDVAAQRGVGQIVARTAGEFVKQPTSVRVRTGDEF